MNVGEGRRDWTFRMTPTRYVLLCLAAIGTGFAVFRLLFGLGAATNLNDRWPWGLWVWWDVMTGVALAGGGYSTALMVHIFGRRRWKAVERGAFLTSLIGYLLVCAGLFLDLGRWINVWRVPFIWELNPHSVMFELVWCVTGYTVVQIVEFGYIFVERVHAPRLARLLSRIYVPVLIVGITLPILHQSALGSLYLLANGRLDPLWWSQFLPAFFLVSSFFVGPAMVTVESFLSVRAHGRRLPIPVLGQMVRVSGVLMLAYVAARAVDLILRGAARSAFDGSVASTLFLVELGVCVMLPACLFLAPNLARRPDRLVLASVLTVVGVALNRANVVFTGMAATAAGAMYVPSLAEVGLTVGLLAAGVLAYLFAVDNFPIYPPGRVVPAAPSELRAIERAPAPARAPEPAGVR